VRVAGVLTAGQTCFHCDGPGVKLNTWNIFIFPAPSQLCASILIVVRSASFNGPTSARGNDVDWPSPASWMMMMTSCAVNRRLPNTGGAVGHGHGQVCPCLIHQRNAVRAQRPAKSTTKRTRSLVAQSFCNGSIKQNLKKTGNMQMNFPEKKSAGELNYI